jgi:parallel beta-helix repeat protein
LNYTTIQEAINAPKTLGNHTILVEAGTYFEHVVVNKSINLVGENKDNTIIDGSRAGTVVKVTSDNVSITGLTVQNSGHMGSDSGILLYDVSFSNISDNIVTSNKYGIRLDWSNNNSIRDNIATNSEHGIHISYFSSNNTVAENTANLIWMQAALNNIIVDNNVNGIGLYDGCNSNKLARNSIHRNGGTGILLYAVSNNLLLNNTASSNTGYGIRFFRSHNNILYGNNASNNGDGIAMDESNGNNLTRNIVLNNGRGIWVHYYSDDNILVGNIVSNNREGIRVSQWTNNNSLVNNIVSSNTGYGIRLWDARNNVITGNIISNNLNGISLEANSYNNLFFHNNIIDNIQQAVSDGSSSIWDNGYPSGGNYWSNHIETDNFTGPYQNLTGSDGIVDTSYVIDVENQDNYPLTNPWTPLVGDIDGDRDVDRYDFGILAGAYGTSIGQPRYHVRCDLDQDGDIDRYDFGILATNYGKSM